MNVASLRLFNAPAQDGNAPPGFQPPGVFVTTADGTDNALSLALTAGRMKSDPVFRDAAHHFLASENDAAGRATDKTVATEDHQINASRNTSGG